MEMLLNSQPGKNTLGMKKKAFIKTAPGILDIAKYAT